MNIHTIKKEFDFCYGHRVHNQMLDPEYAVDTCLVCRHLHGHQGKIIVTLSSETLASGMVTDFKHLGWMKTLVDHFLDHKMILDINDPVLPSLFPTLFTKRDSLVYEEILPGIQIKVVAPHMYEGVDKPIMEIYEGLVFVDFVPTSENISKWLYEIVFAKMNKIVGIRVQSVEFKETPKTSAYYGK